MLRLATFLTSTATDEAFVVYLRALSLVFASLDLQIPRPYS